MNEFFKQADRIPVTLVIAVAYGTLFVLTNLGVAAEDYGEALATYGMMMPLWVVDGEPWRLVSAAFLHFNLIHIGLNMLGLLALGPSLEMALGSVRYALLYLVAAVGGHIACCLVYAPQQPVLGGSGALFGMMGAIVAINMRSGRHLFSFLEFEGPRRMLGLIAMNIVIGMFIPIVSNTGHVGGLIAGFLITFLWLQTGRESGTSLRRWRAACTALFVSLTFWCVEPATRWDHSWIRSDDASPDRKQALRAAAVIGLIGDPHLPRAVAELEIGPLAPELSDLRKRK